MAMKEVESWREEQQSAYLYRLLADLEHGTAREKLFAELAHEAESQAAFWLEAVRKAGGAVPSTYRPGSRTRIVVWLTRRFGPQSMRSVLAAMKVRGMSVYGKPEPGHPMPEPSTGMERRHRGLASGGNLRAAVFGVNDGLVSNASLILGVAGAAPEAGVVALSGVAGLLAGAFSMAAGEYISVRSQREMYEYQIALERDELSAYPQEEAAELALIYEARGLDKEEAQRLAQTMIADPKRGLDTLAREELGLNPEELGSPWGAAAFSFLSFAVGASIPLVPFLVVRSGWALPVSVGLTAVALFAVGATLSLFTGRHAWRGGLRMLAIGAAAGALTFGIGRLLSVSLG
jgi:VIT1/CCC1 family predicted Fe2+/Mn2+ transporter